MTDTAADISNLTFEQALGELEKIVSELESGQAPLERSIDIYERGARDLRGPSVELGRLDARRAARAKHDLLHLQPRRLELLLAVGLQRRAALRRRPTWSPWPSTRCCPGRMAPSPG